MVDALGNLVRFVLLPGQRHDSVGVEPLIEKIAFDALLGDKAFDNDWLRAELDQRGASAVIPPKADRARQISCDFDMYKWRHLVENFFCDLKQFRRLATRYEKTDESYEAMIHLAGTRFALK
jgi:transposase